MIDIFAYHLQQQAYLLDLTVADLPTALTNENLLLWVDFDHPTPEELALLDTVFYFDPLAIEDCIHGRQTPKLESFTNYHFFIVQTTHPSHTHKDPFHYTNTELDSFLSDQCLVTHHSQPIPAINDLKRRIKNKTCRMHQGITYLTYELLDQMIDAYLPVLDYLEDKIHLLNRTLQDHPFTEKESREYGNLSTHILDLRRIASKNQQVFYQLSHSSLQFIDSDEARLFRDIYDHVVRVVDLTEYYQHSLHDTLDIQLSLNANRMNQVVQLLTLVATIMLPLNVITGIYGMNFDQMPYLHSHYGFWGTVVVMVLIILSLLFYFRRRRWI